MESRFLFTLCLWKLLEDEESSLDGGGCIEEELEKEVFGGVESEV